MWIRSLIGALLLITWSVGEGRSQALQVVQTCGTPNAPLTVGSANGPVTVDVNGNFCSGVSISLPTIGSVVPTTGVYDSVNVAGMLRGVTGVSPTGSVYSPQIDLSSLGGATLAVDPCSPLASTAKSSVAINITTATTTSLVAVSGAKAVYICGFVFTISEVVTTPNTLEFEYGTGASCTGTTALTGLFGGGGVTAGDPIVISAGNGGATVFTAPASNGVCAVTAVGASGSFQGVLTYVQQ